MVVVGITGPIGAGKSAVAELLRARGAEVIDADRLAHEFLEPDCPTYRRVVEAFGPGVLNAAGRIDRERLGALAFENQRNLEQLNGLIHPVLVEALEKRIRQFRSGRVAEGSVLGIDAALLFQWGLERQCDFVLWIDASAAIRRERLVRGGRLDAEEFERRDALQRAQFEHAPPGGRIERIVNGGTQSELTEQINRFWKKVVDHEKQRQQ